jgi:hypothetical protein
LAFHRRLSLKAVEYHGEHHGRVEQVLLKKKARVSRAF